MPLQTNFTVERFNHKTSKNRVILETFNGFGEYAFTTHESPATYEVIVRGRGRNRYNPNVWGCFRDETGHVPPAFKYVPPDVDLVRVNSRYNALGWSDAGFVTYGVPYGSPVNLLLGNTTNGYGVEKDEDGNAYIVKYVAGAKVKLNTVVLPNDNKYHTFKLSIIPGVTNQIEASLDGTKFPIVFDNSLTLTSGSWPISLNAGASGKARHFKANMSVNHHTALPSTVTDVINYNSGLGQLNVLPAGGVTGLLPYANHAAAITGVIDLNGNILSNPWGVASGVVETSNGEFTGFSTSGTSTHAQHPVNELNTVINISARLKLTTTGTDSGIIIGTQTSGYGVTWNGSTGSVDLGYWASGTFHVLSNLGTMAQDTNWHALGCSLTNVSGQGKVEASFDNIAAIPIVDGHVTLSAQKPGTVFMLPTGFIADWVIQGDLPLFSEMHKSVQTALDVSGNSLIHIFGNTSGVGISPTNGCLTNFGSGGQPTVNTYPFTIGVPVTISAIMQMPTPGVTTGIYVGNTTSGYGIEWTSSGAIVLVSYASGRSVLQTITTQTQDNALHTYTLTVMVTGVGPTTASVSGAFDWNIAPSASSVSNGYNPTSGSTILFNPGGNAGLVENPIITTGSTPALANPSLDYINDGSTYERVLGTDVSSGHIAKTYNVEFANSNIYRNSNFHLAGWPANTLVATNISYPIANPIQLKASGWLSLGGTGTTVFWIIGDTTNGWGLRWTTGTGALALMSWKTGTPTLHTSLTAVTMDTKWHWLSISVTPGATPGSSDIVEAYFDGQHTGPTTEGALQVTWGSTASFNVNPGDAGALIHDFRLVGAGG